MNTEHKAFYFGSLSCPIDDETCVIARVMMGWYKDRKQAEKWLRVRMDRSVFYSDDEKYLFTKFSESRFDFTDMWKEWKGIK